MITPPSTKPVPDSFPSQETRAWPYAVLTVPVEVAEDVAAMCFDLGSCGLQSEDTAAGVRLTAYFSPEAALQEMAPQLAARLAQEGLGHCEAAWEWEGERDWLHEWRAFCRPVWATPRIVVHPPWLPVVTHRDQVAISVEPRMAFGTGGHESTQLCLRGIDELARPGSRCLDVGTGSGVLAIALVKLGADRVLAVDVDEVCVENARHNAAQNLGNAAARVEVRQGSMEVVTEGYFDLVAANLESHLLRPLIEPIRQRLAPGGRAVFSGILDREQAAFESWLGQTGLAPTHSWDQNGWVCVAATPEGRE